MEIGIFGDSFSYEKVLNDKYSDHSNIDKIGYSWVTHLRNDFSIENYSVKGCEPFYMYKKFVKEHKKYDKIIFVFPRPGRFSLNLDDKEIHIPHVPNIENLINSSKTQKEKEIYMAYKCWYDHLRNDHKECFFANLLKKEIKNIRPDAFIIYGANWMFKDKTSPIIHISYQENDAWNESFWTIRDSYVDLRYNHLIKENNELLYKYISKCIKENKRIKINPKEFIVPDSQMKDTYLIKK